LLISYRFYFKKIQKKLFDDALFFDINEHMEVVYGIQDIDLYE